jgi:hypothetical protein
MLRTIVLTLSAALLSSQALAAFPIYSLALEGDAVPGVGNITRIDNVVLNSLGQWYVEADTDLADSDSDQVLVGGFQNSAFALAYQENQPLTSPAGAMLNTFDDITLNDSGNLGWNLFLDGTTGSSDDSGIYFNDQLIIQESDLEPAIEAGTPYIGFFGTKINNNNQMLVMASVDAPSIASTVDRALVRIDNPGGVPTRTPIALEGDEPFPGRFITDFGTGPHQWAFNDSGSVMYRGDLDGDSTNDTFFAIDGVVVAREGDASPVAGRNYGSLSSQSVDLNNNGDYVFKADLDGDTATDDMIVKNGVKFIQTGDLLPNGFILTSIGSGTGSLSMDDAGNILWYGDWNDADTDIDTGLFLNDILLVQEGVTMIDGLVVDTISSGQDAFYLSRNGEWVIFEATLEGGIEGAFLIAVPEPSSLALFAALGLSLMVVRRR